MTRPGARRGTAPKPGGATAAGHQPGDQRLLAGGGCGICAMPQPSGGAGQNSAGTEQQPLERPAAWQPGINQDNHREQQRFFGLGSHRPRGQVRLPEVMGAMEVQPDLDSRPPLTSVGAGSDRSRAWRPAGGRASLSRPTSSVSREGASRSQRPLSLALAPVRDQCVGRAVLTPSVRTWPARTALEDQEKNVSGARCRHCANMGPYTLEVRFGRSCWAAT